MLTLWWHVPEQSEGRVSVSTTPIIPFWACHTTAGNLCGMKNPTWLGNRCLAPGHARLAIPSALFIYFLPVIVLPTFVSKFIGAATTVFTVETDVLATFLVVFDTELPMEVIGLKSDAALQTAGCTFIKRIDNTTTADKTCLILTDMDFTFLICCQREISALRATTPMQWIEAGVSQNNQKLSRAVFAAKIDLVCADYHSLCRPVLCPSCAAVHGGGWHALRNEGRGPVPCPRSGGTSLSRAKGVFLSPPRPSFHSGRAIRPRAICAA